MHEVENFFSQFPNPWTLRVSGMGGYTSKCEKSQNHCTLMDTPAITFFHNNQLPSGDVYPIQQQLGLTVHVLRVSIPVPFVERTAHELLVAVRPLLREGGDMQLR